MDAVLWLIAWGYTFVAVMLCVLVWMVWRVGLLETKHEDGDMARTLESISHEITRLQDVCADQFAKAHDARVDHALAAGQWSKHVNEALDRIESELNRRRGGRPTANGQLIRIDAIRSKGKPW